MGVHAVAQGQMGYAPAVLPPEVVGDGIIILRCVCEGLGGGECEVVTLMQFTSSAGHKTQIVQLIQLQKK